MALMPAERRMVRLIKADPYYRPQRRRTRRRFDKLVRDGVIAIRGGRAILSNPGPGLGRIVVVRDDGEPDALYVGYTTASEPSQAIAALGRGNVRPLSLAGSWRADIAEYDRLMETLAPNRIRGCWFDAKAVRRVKKAKIV